MFPQFSAVDLEGMSGKVKRLDEKISTISVKDGRTKEEVIPGSHYFVFDKDGRLTYAMYTFEGSSTEKQCIYDKNGVRKCSSETTSAFSKSGPSLPSLSASVFKFDAAENSMTEDTYTPKMQNGGPAFELNDLGQRYKYYFDASKRMTKKIVLSSDGAEVSTYEYFYRSSGPPSDMALTSHGRLIQAEKYTYDLDDHGNWTKRTSVSRFTNAAMPESTTVSYRKVAYYEK
ncbi:MAG: hypothetical protein ABI999_03900 [Acidobacteriota bacterium]